MRTRGCNPLRAADARPFAQIGSDKAILRTRRRIGPRQDKQLLPQSNHAVGNRFYALGPHPHIVGQRPPKHQLGLQFQPTERSAKLVRGMADEAFLRLHGIVEPDQRSEEHTSELQSLMRISYAVFCFKKQKSTKYTLYNEHD